MRAYNETLYDRAMIVRYNRHYLAEFYRRNFIIIAAGAAIAAAFSFAEGQWETGLVILGMIVVYALLTAVIQTLVRNRALKRSPITKHPIIRTYLFDDRGIDIDGRYQRVEDSSLAAESGVQRRRLDYEAIVQVQNRRQFMMIRDAERRTYLVDAAGFESAEQAEELHRFLATTLGKRYR
jgi:hypothetical protein